MTNIDIDILLHSKQGDTLAFRQVVVHYQSFAYAVAYRMLGNKMDAEEVVQDSFVKVWDKLGSYDVEKKFSTWLFKIITNKCIDKIRKEKNIGQRTQGLEGVTRAGENLPLAEKDLVEKVHLLTLNLADKQRAVFVLVDLEGFDHTEAAEILGVSTENIKSNLYQARKTLRTQLTKLINFNTNSHEKL